MTIRRHRRKVTVRDRYMSFYKDWRLRVLDCGFAHGRVRERTHGSGLLTPPQPAAIERTRRSPLSWAAGSRLPTYPAWQAACRP